MTIEKKIAEAFRGLVDDAESPTLGWDGIETMIRHETRRRTITFSIATAAVLAIAVVMFVQTPRQSAEGIGMTNAPPSLDTEDSFKRGSPTTAASFATRAPRVETIPVPPPPPASAAPASTLSRGKNILEGGSVNGLDWVLRSVRGADRDGEAPCVDFCIDLALESVRGARRFRSWDVPMGNKAMEYIITSNDDVDWGTRGVVFIFGAAGRNVASVRIERGGEQAVTLNTKRDPASGVDYFFTQLRTDDRITAVVALDASGGELQRDPRPE